MNARTIICTHGRETAPITCPQCGKSKTIDLTPFHAVRQAVKVACPCRATFEVFFENRRDPRRAVTLPAQLLHPETGAVMADVTITSLSLSGVSFTPALPDRVQPGDRLRIVFVLDDASQAAIDKSLIIRYVQADKTGAEFVEHGYHYDLDFYLMPLFDRER
jgi:hypothetical protein